MRDRQPDPHQDRQVDNRRGPQLGARSTERLRWQFNRTGRYAPIYVQPVRECRRRGFLSIKR
jgi:hypothetical protein